MGSRARGDRIKIGKPEGHLSRNKRKGRGQVLGGKSVVGGEFSVDS